MTSTDLERIARDLLPPVGTTGVTLDVDHEPGERLRNGSPAGIGGQTRYRIAWLVGGRRRLPDGPAFDRARDARRLMDLLAGAPAPRPAPVFPADGPTAPPAGPQRGRTGAPDVEAIPRTRGIEPATTPDPAQQADVGRPTRSCVRCGRPLPPGSRSQRRTCSGACRLAAWRRPDEIAPAVDTDSAEGPETVSAASTGGIHPGQVPSARESADRPTAAPVCRAGARGTKRSRRARAAHTRYPNERPGAEPLGVARKRSAGAPRVTAPASAGSQPDGDSAGSERAIASATPGRNAAQLGLFSG